MCKTSVNNEHKKIKASYAQIVSRRISVKPHEKEPYFEIVYFDTEKGKNYCGFGSFSLEYVEKWLKEEFEPGYKNIDQFIDDLLDHIEIAENANSQLDGTVETLMDSNKKLSDELKEIKYIMEGKDIVQCKDCKHFGNLIKEEKYSCKNYQLPYCRPKDFCSYGKKR